MTPHEEIAAVLRSAINGDVKIIAPEWHERLPLSKRNWGVDSEPTFEIGGWKITFFVEAFWPYDIYYAKAPDGREFEFHHKDENCSIELFITEEEVRKLCDKLGIIYS